MNARTATLRRPCAAQGYGTWASATRGFTLIELLVALAVTAILALLATSGYEATMLRSRRLDARAALVAIASAQERHYLEYGLYARRLDPASQVAGAANALPLAPTSPDGHYTLELATDAHALEYVATARARGGQQRDQRCAQLALDHAGHRSATNAHGSNTTSACWR